MHVHMCVSETYFNKVPDQTESVVVVLEALLLCQLREENRQKEAKGRKWGSYRARDGEGWLPARSVYVSFFVFWGGGVDKGGQAIKQILLI